MTTVYAADLKRGDAVILWPGERRVVEAVEFHDRPIGSDGTTGVRVHWFGIARWSLIAADKELAVEDS